MLGGMNTMHSDRRSFNGGDLLHLVQVVVLIASLGASYEKFQEIQTSVETHNQQLNRIEHYLSSRDNTYWKKTEEIR
jgi:hypothetical protein